MMLPMKRIIDITRSIHPAMATWPGDPTVAIERVHRVEDGAASNVSAIHLGTHTGTHVDPPLHLFAGTTPVDEIPLDILIGDAVVAENPSDAPDGTTRLLLRNAAPLDPATARALLHRGVRLIGTDHASIEPPDSLEVHRALLAAGVVIVEGLDLTDAPPGPYSLICLPLKIAGGDGAPARAVLIEPCLFG